jgi:hypothetical protein
MPGDMRPTALAAAAYLKSPARRRQCHTALWLLPSRSAMSFCAIPTSYSAIG